MGDYDVRHCPSRYSKYRPRLKIRHQEDNLLWCCIHHTTRGYRISTHFWRQRFVRIARKINGKHGMLLSSLTIFLFVYLPVTELEATPEGALLRYMHRSVPFKELSALYSVADVCLLTSKMRRDGPCLLWIHRVSGRMPQSVGPVWVCQSSRVYVRRKRLLPTGR